MLNLAIGIVRSIIAIIILFLMIFTTAQRIIKTERKRKELLPNEKGITRLWPFPEINPHSIPQTKNGKLFLKYRQKYIWESAKIFAIVFGLIGVSFILEQIG